MKFCFIDYRPLKSNINRDMTGNFGSNMSNDSLTTKFLSVLKRNSLKIPIISYAQAASILSNENHSYTVYEGFPDEQADIFIFMTSIINLKQDVDFLKKLKKTYPQSKVGIVGAINKAMPHLFNNCIDFNIKSELDTAILRFVENKWNFEGEFNEPNIQDLDIFPIPNWDHFPVSSYKYKPGLTKGNFLTIQSSRGCSFNCDYCSYMVVQGGKTRNRSLDLIKEELDYLISNHNVKSVLFRDILFGYPKKRFYEIIELLSEYKSKIEWGCETRIELLTSDIIEKAFDAGMRLVNIGIESPNISILAQNGKHTFSNDNTFKRVIELNEKNIKVQAFYMLGLFGDNKKTILQTIDYAKKLNTFAAQFCLPTPYPGTKFAVDNLNNTYEKDIQTYDAYTPQIKVDGMTSEELQKLHSFAYKSFYTNPKWIRKNLLKASLSLL